VSTLPKVTLDVNHVRYGRQRKGQANANPAMVVAKKRVVFVEELTSCRVLVGRQMHYFMRVLARIVPYVMMGSKAATSALGLDFFSRGAKREIGVIHCIHDIVQGHFMMVLYNINY